MPLHTVLLQIPTAGDIASGLSGDYGRDFLQNNSDLLILIVFILVVMLSLTEPLKLVLRKNIGLNALSLLGVLAGCSVYFAWGILTAGVTLLIGGFAIETFPESKPATCLLVVQAIYCGVQVYYVFKFTLRILHLGMMEHYRAKAQNTLSWEVLEYRGDSFLLDSWFKHGWTTEKVWRIAEPKFILKSSILYVLVMPIIGIPMFFTSISFWLNEWYHVYFKHERLKKTYLDIRIEMQKANIYYNQPATGSSTARVSAG